MPELPRYQQKQTLPDRRGAGAQTNVQAASATARATADLAQVAQSGIEYFAKLKMANEESDAKIRAAEQIAALDQDITANPELWDEDKVAERLNEIDENVQGVFTFQQARDNFKLDFGMTKIQAQVGANTKLRAYQIEKRKVNEELEVETAYSIEDPAQREVALDEIYRTSWELGMYSNSDEIRAKKDAQMKEWQLRDVMNKAYSDPEEALRIAEGIENVEEKKKAIAQVHSIVAQEKERYKIASFKTYTENQTKFDEMLSNPEISYAEKVRQVNEADFKNMISDDYAVEARRWLESEKKLKALESSDVYAQILRMGYDINAKFEQGEITEAEFLQAVNDIQVRIKASDADGHLHGDSATKLSKEFTTVIKKNVASATVAAAAFLPQLQDADEYFKNALPPYLQNEALRQYFKIAGTQERDPESAMAIAQFVEQQLETQSRAEVNAAMNAAGDVSIAMIRDNQTGEQFLAQVDQNGQPVLDENGEPKRIA